MRRTRVLRLGVTSTHATLGHRERKVEPLSTGQEVLAVLEVVEVELDDDPVDDPDVDDPDVDVVLALEVEEALEEDASVEVDPPERESVR